MKFRKFIITLLLTLMLPISLNAAHGELEYLFHKSSDSNSDKISYSIYDFEELKSGDRFKLEIYSDDKLVDETCEKLIDLNSETYYIKFICDIKKLPANEYTLSASIIQQNGYQLTKTISKLNIQETGKSSVKYKILENETLVTLEVESDLESYQVEHYIPKEIIEHLDKTNQDKLIDSELNYTILDADPIIAWNIDESPKTIEYKIKKQTNEKDLENLSVKINENSNTYKYLSYVLYILILVIIGIVLKPMFIKNGKAKK